MSDDYHDALVLLADLQSEVTKIKCARGAAQQSYEEWLSGTKIAKQTSSSEKYLQAELAAVTKHLSRAWQSPPDYFDALVSVLADATRKQSLWRALFGLRLPNEHDQYESVLHVAVQIIKSGQREPQSLVKNCLRIIANCCADNNLNRRFVLDHAALQSLVELCSRNVELDALIPTIYNICNEYQDPEPASSEATAAAAADSSSLDNEPDMTHTVSFALQQLAAAAPPQSATFQIFLTLTPYCSDDRREFLAELVEFATLPLATGPRHSDTNGDLWSWISMNDRQKQDTLVAAERLAGSSIECRIHIMRALLHLLAPTDACKSLLSREDNSIWHLVGVFSPKLRYGIDEVEEFGEDFDDCRKQFLKLFYQITGLPEFTALRIMDSLSRECITRLLAVYKGDEQSSTMEEVSPNQLFNTCCLIMLAQLAASDSQREQYLEHNSLTEILHDIMVSEDHNDILYPAVTFIARLSLSPREVLPIVSYSILHAMQRLLTGQGRGLTVPFEVVNAFRMVIRNRPHYLALFVQNESLTDASVVSAVFNLFDKTIEAGTKLEVGHFCIEILRTMFPALKDLDTLDLNEMPTEASAFASFLEPSASKVAKILTFVCAQAEPQHNRRHGWFGLGMLSVWRQGRLAIIQCLAEDGLGEAVTKVLAEDSESSLQNLKLMLSKMQACSRAELPSSVAEQLETAATACKLQLSFVE